MYLQLLNIKDQQIQANKQLEQARQALAACSLIDDKAKWYILLGNVEELAIKHSQITIELTALESKFILFLLNRLICFFLDIHVNINHGRLPY